MLEQQAHRLRIARGPRIAERRFIAFGLDPRVGAAFKQEANRGRISTGCRRHQRRRARTVRRIDRCLRVEEDAQGRFTTAASRHQQRGSPAARAQIGIGTVFEQEAEGGGSIPKDGRQIERRLATRELRIDVGPACQQQAHLGFLRDGPVQRSRATTVLRIHVRSGIDQPLQGLDRAEAGRMMQQGRFGGIRRSH